MKLASIGEPFDHPGWIFELKYDGWRAVAHVTHERCRLISRNGHVYSSFSRLSADLARLPDCILDGEIVCLDADGCPRFYDIRRRPGDAVFVAFDVLEINGRDVKRISLIERKAALRKLIPNGSRILYASHIDACGTALYREACRRDLEGIVAKWKYRHYVCGYYQPNDR
jgi:bifunctional non-homologous end joining protein LigD